MNDRFKFRVWDKTEKIMHFTDFVVTSTGYVAKLNNLYNVEYDNETDEEMEIQSENEFMIDNSDVYFEKDKILMQCTGLKDKNGKLIYEGDIVKIGNGSVNGSVIETTREVKWTINTWNIPVWVVDKPNFSHYVEVIGNIYENKELLESEG